MQVFLKIINKGNKKTQDPIWGLPLNIDLNKST